MIGLVNFGEFDLLKYPGSQKSASSSSSSTVPDCTKRWATLGDLHGNSLKLLGFLCLEEIVAVEPSAYRAMIGIYAQSESSFLAIRKFGVQSFYDYVLPNIRVTPGAKFRAIGDIVGDRGGNDLYTLEIIGKLMDGGAEVEILLSNHDGLFIRWMEARLKNPNLTVEERAARSWGRLNEGQADSLERLDELIEMGIVSMADVEKLYKEKYLKALKVLSYDYDEHGQLMLYSHAHVDERDVLSMAKGLLGNAGFPPDGILKNSLSTLCEKLDANNDMISQEDTIKLIECINELAKYHAEKGTLTELFDINSSKLDAGKLNGKLIDPEINPIHFPMWNRDDLDNRADMRPKNPRIINPHGHNTYRDAQKNEVQQMHAIGLNNRFGYPGNTRGDLTYLRTLPADTPKNKFVAAASSTSAASAASSSSSSASSASSSAAATSPDPDDSLRLEQIKDLVQFLMDRGNLRNLQLYGSTILDIAQTRFDDVYRVCDVLNTHLKTTDSLYEPDVLSKPQNREAINNAWQAVDDVIQEASAANNTTKMKRRLQNAATGIYGPKATTDGTIQHWNEYKAAHHVPSPTVTPSLRRQAGGPQGLI